jgi:hypothetical protein
VSRRLGRSLVTWSLAVIVGGFSVLGEGLHEFLGVHAGIKEGPVACEYGSHGLFHDSGLGQGNGRSVQAAGHREGCHDPSTCPICQYLSQGKVIAARFAVVLVAVSVPDQSSVIPLFVPSSIPRPFQARAPPAV